MEELRRAAENAREKMKALGAQQYACTLQKSELKELNADNGEFSLFRTVFDQNVSATVIHDKRKGSVQGNDLSPERIGKVCEEAFGSAASSAEDDAYAFAPSEGALSFSQGCPEADVPAFFDRLSELKEQITALFPKVHLMSLSASHTKETGIYFNSNGTWAEQVQGWYDVGLEFAGQEGEKTTGFFGTGVKVDSLDRPFLELGTVRRSLEDAQNSLNSVTLPEKFTGTVVFTPDALGQFVYMLAENYMGSSVIMEGTSQWLNRVGEQVADPRLTVSLRPLDLRIVCGERVTRDGFLSENVDLIRNGVLERHFLDLYAANKTGRPVVKCTSEDLVIEPGDVPLEELMGQISRGIVIGYFAGGEPNASGDFSGVAKNAFYIENGRILGGVSEVMINGKLDEIFNHILGITKESFTDGRSCVPMMAADGIVISGK